MAEPHNVHNLLDSIHTICKKMDKQINLMEVCGTHTVSIFRHGIRDVLPKNIRLLSGPGCPVCVTSKEDVEKAMKIASSKDIIFTTFGDMMRVPGNKKNLDDIKAEGADIRVVYSPMDALNIAKKTGERKVVFFATGFETTSPSIAATLYNAEEEEIDNFYIYCVHKLVPPAIEAILNTDKVNIDGFILPGHVSTIIGLKPYMFISEKYGKAGVITGFGAEDIIEGILALLEMVLNNKETVEIQYREVVRKEGNTRAVKMIYDYFLPADVTWRGIGTIPLSGLNLRDEYRHRDINSIFDIKVDVCNDPEACECGDILKGIKLPNDCRLFGNACTPEHPVGPCMVSIEGSCSAYYKYSDARE